MNVANGSATGSYNFVAANGDTLSSDFTGQGTPTPTPGVLSIVDTATITGGTGRFAGATGGFTCQRLLDTVALTTAGSFEGTISSPGARQILMAPAGPPASLRVPVAQPAGPATEAAPWRCAAVGSVVPPGRAASV